MQGTQVRFLAGELGSHMLHSAAKKLKKKKEKKLYHVLASFPYCFKKSVTENSISTTQRKPLQYFYKFLILLVVFYQL